MSISSDAADQVVKMSLDGVNIALRLTGTAAKELVLLILAALKSPDKAHDATGMKLSGKERLKTMLKSGVNTDVFAVKNDDLKAFQQEAKRYGITYCALRDSKAAPDGLCEIMVKESDASKVNRIAENLKFATVAKAHVEHETAPSRGGAAPDNSERGAVDTPDNKQLGGDEGKTEVSKPRQAPQAKVAHQNPDAAKTEKSPPSAPSSTSKSKSAKGTSSKPSVRGALRDIAASNKKKAADAPTRETTPKSKSNKRQPAAQHTQPQGKRGANNRNSKSKGR